MRSKVLLLTGFVVAIVLMWFFFRQQKQGNILSKRTTQSGQPSAASLSSASVVLQKTNSLSQANVTSAVSQLSSVDDREKTNEIRQYMESQNQPIEFYGQVVDQDGNPLSGARMKGLTLHVKVIVPAPWGDKDEITPIEKTTDSAGRFEVNGISGRSLEIDSIQKEGYEAEPIKRIWGVSGGSFENPIIFKMWSTNIHEQLIIGDKAFEIVPDGRLYFIDLTTGTISESGTGDLKVWIQYTNQVVQGQLYDWSAGIEVINGGLLEVPQQAINSGFWPEPPFAMYSAPQGGYTPSFSLQRQVKGGQSGEIGNRYFYLLLKNGKEYGRMSINLFAPYGRLHPGLIRLSYAINPSGSRILKP